MLGRVDVACAEQHREQRHRQRDIERHVAEQRPADFGGRHGVRDDRFQRERHRLELQRDVGDRADDRDQRDGCGDRLALAVACGDEIGDRGDVLRLGEPHHPSDHRREQADHQHRADIDGEELVAAARGRTDRAEERPGGAVDRKRQRIDQESRAAVAAETPDTIAIACHKEQEPDVAERNRNNDPALQHAAFPPGVLKRRGGRKGPFPARSLHNPRPCPPWRAGAKIELSSIA